MLDEIGVFARGLVIGVMVAAPVGPVGLLCIRRTLQRGLAVGFASGFGAAFADAFFALIAVLGVTVITDFIANNKNAIYIVGSLFLLFVAWHTWHDKPRQANTKDVEKKYLSNPRMKHIGRAARAMATSFIITITNPATLFGVLAVVATLSGIESKTETAAIVGGIFSGSALWWLALSGGVSLFRHRFSDRRVMAINHVTSIVLALIAVFVMGTGIWNLIK